MASAGAGGAGGDLRDRAARERAEKLALERDHVAAAHVRAKQEQEAVSALTREAWHASDEGQQWERTAKELADDVTAEQRTIVNRIMKILAAIVKRVAVTHEGQNPYGGDRVPEDVSAWLAWLTSNDTCIDAFRGVTCTDTSCRRTKSHNCVLCMRVGPDFLPRKVSSEAWDHYPDSHSGKNYMCPVMDALDKGLGDVMNDFDMFFRCLHYMYGPDHTHEWFLPTHSRITVEPAVFRVLPRDSSSGA